MNNIKKMKRLQIKDLTVDQYRFYKQNIFNGVGTSFLGINPLKKNK